MSGDHGVEPLWLAPLRVAVERHRASSGRPRRPVQVTAWSEGLSPVSNGDTLEIVFVTDVAPLLDDAAAGARARLGAWLDDGHRVAVATRTAARALGEVVPVGSGSLAVAPLPLPPARLPPSPGRAPTEGHVLAVRPPYDVFMPALQAVRALCGRQLYTTIAAVDARPYTDPGGLSQLYGFLGGLEVGATADWREVVDQAAIVAWFPASLDEGFELREALAAGRPVVLPDSPVARDHLRATGAPAYLFAGLHDPVELARALDAALAKGRGPAVADGARKAVMNESWDDAAAALISAVEPPPRRRTVPPVRSSDRLSLAVVDTWGSDGGGERLLGEIVRGLARHPSNPDVRLVCVHDRARQFTPPYRRARAAGATVVAADPEEIEEEAAAHVASSDVAWYIWAQTTDPPQTATPVVGTIHDIAWRHFHIQGGLGAARSEALVRSWLERADLVTCSSDFIRDDITSAFPSSPAPAVVPLAAPREDGLPAPAALVTVRRRYALPPRFLLSPAPRSRHKNYAVLVAALAQTRRAGAPIQVVATGTGTDQAYWGPDIIGLGYVPAADLAAIRALAAGVVQTTLYEAGSFPVFEAMLDGMPVVASAIPPILEQLARDGTFALTFSPTDPEELAGALRDAWRPDAALDRRFRDNGRLVRRRTWIDVAGDYLGLLGKVAAREGPAVPRAVP